MPSRAASESSRPAPLSETPPLSFASVSSAADGAAAKPYQSGPSNFKDLEWSGCSPVSVPADEGGPAAPNEANALQDWYDEFVGSGALMNLEQDMNESFARLSPKMSQRSLTVRTPPNKPDRAPSMTASLFAASRNTGSSPTRQQPMPVAVDLFSRIQDLQVDLKKQDIEAARLRDANAALIKRARNVDAHMRSQRAAQLSMLEQAELSSRGALLWAQSALWVTLLKLSTLPEPDTLAASLGPPTPGSSTVRTPHRSRTPLKHSPCGAPRLDLPPDAMFTDATISRLEADRAELQIELSRTETVLSETQAELTIERSERKRLAALSEGVPDCGELEQALLNERLRAVDLIQRCEGLEREAASMRHELGGLREEQRLRKVQTKEVPLSDQGSQLPPWVASAAARAAARVSAARSSSVHLGTPRPRTRTHSAGRSQQSASHRDPGSARSSRFVRSRSAQSRRTVNRSVVG